MDARQQSAHATARRWELPDAAVRTGGCEHERCPVAVPLFHCATSSVPGLCCASPQRRFGAASNEFSNEAEPSGTRLMVHVMNGLRCDWGMQRRCVSSIYRPTWRAVNVSSALAPSPTCNGARFRRLASPACRGLVLARHGIYSRWKTSRVTGALCSAHMRQWKKGSH